MHLRDTSERRDADSGVGASPGDRDGSVYRKDVIEAYLYDEKDPLAGVVRFY